MVKIDTLKNVVNTADEYSKIIWREYETLKKNHLILMAKCEDTIKNVVPYSFQFTMNFSLSTIYIIYTLIKSGLLIIITYYSCL